MVSAGVCANKPGDIATSVKSDSVKWKNPRSPQYIVAAAITIGAFSFGNVLGWSSPALPSVMNSGHFPEVTTAHLSLIGSLITLGAVFGAILAGFCIDRIGRVNTLLLSALPLALGWISIAMAQAMSMLYLGRFLTGVAIGTLGSVAPIYTSEICQPDIRGGLCATFQVVAKIGILLTFILGAYIPYNYLAAICAVIPMIFAGCVSFLPESPRYLLSNGQSQKAIDALCWLRASSKETPSNEVLREIEEIQEALNHKNESKSQVADLLLASTMKPLTVVLGLMFFNQVCGGNAFGFYAVMIFDLAGANIDSYLSSVLVGAFQLLATIIASLYVDKAGRKAILVWSFIVMAASLAFLGVYFQLKSMNCIFYSWINLIPLISLIAFNAAYCGGVASLVWTIMSEVLPSNVLGFCSGLTATFNWTLAFVVTLFFHDLNDALMPQYTFWLLAVFCAVAVIFTLFVVPETKGRTLERIHADNTGQEIELNKSPVRRFSVPAPSKPL